MTRALRELWILCYILCSVGSQWEGCALCSGSYRRTAFVICCIACSAIILYQ